MCTVIILISLLVMWSLPSEIDYYQLSLLQSRSFLTTISITTIISITCIPSIATNTGNHDGKKDIEINEKMIIRQQPNDSTLSIIVIQKDRSINATVFLLDY